MDDDWEEINNRFEESQARINAAVASRDPSQLHSATDRCSYSWGLARLGEWDQAEAAARAIDDDEDERGQALGILSQRLAAAGLAERAERVALSVTSDITNFGAVQEKMIALIDCAQSYCSHGLPQDAVRVIETGLADFAAFADASDWQATDWLVDAADVYVKIGQPERALQLLETAAEMVQNVGMDRAQIQRQIALKFASLDRLDQAREVAQSITSPTIRQRTLERLDSLHQR